MPSLNGHQLEQQIENLDRLVNELNKKRQSDNRLVVSLLLQLQLAIQRNDYVSATSRINHLITHVNANT